MIKKAAHETVPHWSIDLCCPHALLLQLMDTPMKDQHKRCDVTQTIGAKFDPQDLMSQESL